VYQLLEDDTERPIAKICQFSIFGGISYVNQPCTQLFLIFPITAHLTGEITAMGLAPATAYVETVSKTETLALTSDLIPRLPETAREAICALAKLRKAFFSPKE
jgi:hypothetical protein